MNKTITLAVQQIGKQLVVCIPDDIAREAQLLAGQSVMLEIPAISDAIRNAEKLTPTLEQMLAQYDPEKSGGEVMATASAGKEIIK